MMHNSGILLQNGWFRIQNVPKVSNKSESRHVQACPVAVQESRTRPGRQVLPGKGFCLVRLWIQQCTHLCVQRSGVYCLGGYTSHATDVGSGSAFTLLEETIYRILHHILCLRKSEIQPRKSSWCNIHLYALCLNARSRRWPELITLVLCIVIEQQA